MINGHVINLENRLDRHNHTIEQLTDTIINPIFINAVKETPGWIGCLKSHIKVLKIAKEQKLDYVLVMEDDNVIIDKKYFNETVAKIINFLSNNLDKWQIFNGSPIVNKHTVIHNDYNLDNTTKLYEITTASSTNFIIYNKNVYDYIINYENIIKYKLKNTYKIDMILSKQFKTLCVMPFICSQKNNEYSDVSTASRTDIDKLYIDSKSCLKKLIIKYINQKSQK